MATAGFGLMSFMALGVALVSARYLLPEVPFPAPPMVIQMANWPMAVLVHVGGGVTALALGSFQLISWRGPRRTWHRWAGRVYVLACLSSAVAGLWLALHATAGAIASLGFGLLAVAWFVTTLQGWRKAMARQLDQHRRWMIRSLSLTFAAVTLRILIPLSQLNGLPFETSYLAISFLCWMPNLLVTEFWLRVWGWKPPATAVLPRIPDNG